MQDFIFQSPTKFVFGRNAIEQIGTELTACGYTHAFIVCGRGSAVKSGLLARVQAQLDEVGVAHTELSGVRPNPEVELVREGIEQARACGADLILPIGGGSVIDCAKAIAFGMLHDGDVWDFFCGKAKVTQAMPIAAVLTIPAAGSEASSSCVISNDELGMKRGTNGDAFRPRFAFLDPQLTYTLPAHQTAAGVTDMIAHICERYFSGQPAAPVTDNICTGIVSALLKAGPRALEDPECYDARATIMWAGTLAHNDLCGCGLSSAPEKRAGGWESHGLEHELSALDPKITHGAGLAVIMPAWMRHVWRENPQRFASFGAAVFGIDANAEDAATQTINALQKFFQSMGMPTTLGELGITESDVPTLVDALAATKGEVFGGFKKLTREDTAAIYRSAL